MTLDGSVVSKEIPKWAGIDKIALCTHTGSDDDVSFSTTWHNTYGFHWSQKGVCLDLFGIAAYLQSDETVVSNYDGRMRDRPWTDDGRYTYMRLHSFAP
eukprot:7914052-Pyramimonas_sp.AAC.1